MNKRGEDSSNTITAGPGPGVCSTSSVLFIFRSPASVHICCCYRNPIYVEANLLGNHPDYNYCDYSTLMNDCFYFIIL